MKQWIRWPGLIGFVVFSVLLVAGWLFAAGPVMKMALEAAGTKAVGAKVDVESVDLTLSPMGIVIQGVQVTDAENPMTNVVSIDRAEADVAFVPLLLGKGIVEEMSLTGVSEKSGKAMTYTIAIVDEGLLGLTQYKTPNLHKQFYKKEALGVRTWDLFDHVVGAYGGNLEKLLDDFIQHRINDYKAKRDFPAIEATSRLSENLTYGEIAPRALWHAGWRAMENGAAGAEHFLKEVVWREFAYHLLHHTPHILDANWRPEWDAFPWNTDADTPEVLAWKQGRTGEPFVDAAMREMYVTGTMHNRSRMIVASYLTKHLMTHWKVGLKWFEDCLTDWDPAANAMGWQWTAGSGPDAAPYFRIFNPETQLEKFDAERVYRKRWIAERYATPTETALSYFDAVPQSWGLSPEMGYPEPIVALDEGRARALEAYSAREK